MLKDLFTKHKKKILVTLSAGILYLIGHFGLGLDVKVSDVGEGNIVAIGKTIEEAPAE